MQCIRFALNKYNLHHNKNRNNSNHTNQILNKRTGIIEDIREIDGLVYAKIKDSNSQWKFVWRVNPTDYQVVVADIKKGDKVKYDVNNLNYAINLVGSRDNCPSSYLSCNSRIDTWQKQPEIDKNPLTISIPDLVLGIATKRKEPPPEASSSELNNNVQYIWTKDQDEEFKNGAKQEEEEEDDGGLKRYMGKFYEDEDEEEMLVHTLKNKTEE